MSRILAEELSRRERQIMEIIYQRGEASAADIQVALPDPPGYSAVRALLALLKKKKMVRHRKAGRQYVYSPVVTRNRARRTILSRVMKNFFENSAANVISTLIDINAQKLSDDELRTLERLIKKHRREGKGEE